jgi:hypothetical protein
MAHSQSVYMSTLRRAAEVIGGFEALAAYLDVRPIYLHAWMNGTLETPTDVFLKVVDLLMYEHFALADKRSARRDHEAHAPEPRAGGAPHREGFR